ncbi:hypothetical protein GIB67_037412 [Kingdonia uniflora]|uniref:Maintenance of Photosystem II under High light 2 C-terminal domain-containing protein n=1 Tax=Kingdonia uniflora TaxID=39325 RepID=A0A7J7M8U5_9MAGN|nr:hypothetical protein GIB67_037412 [Kingdonia uniflora]
MAATSFISTANTSFQSLPSSSSSKHNVRRPCSVSVTLCKATSDSQESSPVLTKRNLAISLTTTLSLFSLSVASKGVLEAKAAILEADDDLELLEKVKKDRKKRLEQQEVIVSSEKERASLQSLIYKLSKVGQAIDNDDLKTASTVLGPSTNADWIKKVQAAFDKLSSTSEEEKEVTELNSSLASLIASVIANDIKSSKLAFVSSATALEKWTSLTGLTGQLKGL